MRSLAAWVENVRSRQILPFVEPRRRFLLNSGLDRLVQAAFKEQTVLVVMFGQDVGW
jgi:hypothetical protein